MYGTDSTILHQPCNGHQSSPIFPPKHYYSNQSHQQNMPTTMPTQLTCKNQDMSGNSTNYQCKTQCRTHSLCLAHSWVTAGGPTWHQQCSPQAQWPHICIQWYNEGIVDKQGLWHWTIHLQNRQPKESSPITSPWSDTEFDQLTVASNTAGCYRWTRSCDECNWCLVQLPRLSQDCVAAITAPSSWLGWSASLTNFTGRAISGTTARCPSVSAIASSWTLYHLAFSKKAQGKHRCGLHGIRVFSQPKNPLHWQTTMLSQHCHAPPATNRYKHTPSDSPVAGNPSSMTANAHFYSITTYTCSSVEQRVQSTVSGKASPTSCSSWWSLTPQLWCYHGQ